MKKKTIALGIDDFKEVAEGNHYLVDKSLFIKEAVEDGSKVILLPRPRRWGKTLNMSMLKYFFEKSENSNRHLFNGLVIEKYEDVMEHQGKYPVIFLTLKDTKQSNWDLCYKALKSVIAKEYQNHRYVLESDFLTDQEKERFNAVLHRSESIDIFKESLHDLSVYLHRYHGVEPIILLDEYDAPIHAGFGNDFYSDIINFMRTFLGAAFKGNLSLKKGFLTGILRVSKESIFSGLNNLKVCTILDEQYSEFFGFSEAEVTTMLEYYGPHVNDTKMKSWYNNYHAGNDRTVYNPWSVLNYIDKKHDLAAHWMGSSDNLLIKEIIQKTPASFKEDLEQLMLGKTIDKRIVDFVTFEDVFKFPDVTYNFFLLTGYLSFERKYLNENNDWIVSLSIPNIEVHGFYRDVVMKWIEGNILFAHYQNMLKDLVSGDIDIFKESFVEIVEDSMSHFDVTGKEPEQFYHAFVLGMLVSLKQTHEVKSNRESGTGRYDVMLIPKDSNKYGIIIEFKKAKNETDEMLAKAAEDALQQINDRNYAVELKARGITKIISLGIALRGKKALIKEQL